jgi:hypothetical protein
MIDGQLLRATQSSGLDLAKLFAGFKKEDDEKSDEELVRLE